MMLFFTSGTTGAPKMAEHSHASYGMGHMITAVSVHHRRISLLNTLDRWDMVLPLFYHQITLDKKIKCSHSSEMIELMLWGITP